MKQFQTVIDEARSELGDTYEGSYAYAAVDMMRYAIEGLREAWRTRPSLKYNVTTGVLYDSDSVVPSINDFHYEVPLPEGIESALTYYVVYKCLSRDITDVGNANAAIVAKARFNQIVTG